ncbi:MAG TPA: geranylgeranyl reductase family protein [archaeon]|nr:geranylgeranyl reductase family protein [archaeon]
MNYDVIISGAGPAGATCALFLARTGKKVLLLDKEKFPRDKVCADNKTWICLDIVKELGLWTEFEKLEKSPIKGVLVASPAGHEMYTPLLESTVAEKGPWYNVRRILFDNMLARACRKEANIEFIENATTVRPLIVNSAVAGVVYREKDGSIHDVFSKVVVAADGSKSPLANELGISPQIKGRHAINARAYYENVKGPMDRCELYYLKGICPGYFWIFPVDEKTCNVGIGMRLEDIEKGKIKLYKKLDELISSEKFASRFSGAKKVSATGVWGLSVLGKRRKCSGDGFVLCGDAGAFAMTFSGEGVGPSMRTGKIAARAIENAFERNDFSAKSLQEYDEMLWGILQPEVNGFSFLETLILNQWLFDFVVRRVGKNKYLLNLSSKMQRDYRAAKEFTSPKAILSLLFG